MKSVWLIKSARENENNYEKSVNDVGFTAESINPLSFNFINESALHDALTRPNDFSGIIFTSPRAVDAVHKSYTRLNGGQHQAWSTKKMFAVGEATATLIKQTLGLEAIGKHCGNAHQLAEFIVKNVPAFDKPLLFPCSNLKKEDLPTLLAIQDRDFRAITCYQTSPDPNLKRNIESLLKNAGPPNVMVFFSPSGVEFTMPVLLSLGMQLSTVRLVALGPSTNAALVSASQSVAGVCSTPSPQGLKHVLQGLATAP